MYRERFLSPGEKTWLSNEDVEQIRKVRCYRRAANDAAVRGAHITSRRAVAREAAAIGARMMASGYPSINRRGFT